MTHPTKIDTALCTGLYSWFQHTLISPLVWTFIQSALSRMPCFLHYSVYWSFACLQHLKHQWGSSIVDVRNSLRFCIPHCRLTVLSDITNFNNMWKHGKDRCCFRQITSKEVLLNSLLWIPSFSDFTITWKKCKNIITVSILKATFYCHSDVELHHWHENVLLWSLYLCICLKLLT